MNFVGYLSLTINKTDTRVVKGPVVSHFFLSRKIERAKQHEI